MDRGTIGLVLSGGGALGAYEVGALLHVARRVPSLLERVRIVTGSSVGAVNAAYLVGRGLTPGSVEELADLWRSMKVERLISLSPMSALRMLGAAPLRLLGRGIRSPATGILDPDGLWRSIEGWVDWAGIHDRVEAGRFDAFAVAGTDIGTGRTHLFVEGSVPERLGEPGRIGDFDTIAARIDSRHVRASGSIPILFPPVVIDGRWYMDGGVRHNTPLSPALHLGADQLLILNVRSRRTPSAGTNGYPGIGQVLGTILDSVFLDRVGFDVDRLERVNDVVCAASRMGEAERARFEAELRRVGRPIYRFVPHVSIQPETSFGRLAVSCVSERDSICSLSFIHVLSALFEDDVHTAGDAASFLLFDGEYAGCLIESGRADAERVHDELAAL